MSTDKTNLHPCDDASANQPQMGPSIAYDRETDIIAIDGYRFARKLFSQFTASPLGVRFRIVQRESGLITVATDRDPIEAAAADLLAAAKEALTQAEGCFHSHYQHEHAEPAEPQHIAMLRAAIAKAEGQPT